MTPTYLRVTNYERYQHYKNRRPIWIKLYVDLLDDYQLKKQKPHVRLLAMLLLLVAAKQDNRIPHDPEWLAQELQLGAGSVAAGIETLVAIGLLSVAGRKHSASKTLAKRYQVASPEVEVEKRRKNLSPLGIERQKLKLAACPECHVGGGAHAADCRKGRAA